ncbi:MAG: Spy/CpxP family protein refolding chaperone [Nevskia sp.]|nr:Spy/CpxP family protein refolding chaperone [Nevskia sp.]
MRKLILLPTAVLAAAMLCTAVQAQDSSSSSGGSSSGSSSGAMHGWHHHHHGGALMFVLRKLDLSAEQKASVKQLMQQAHGQLKPQMEALRADRQAFNEATPGSSGYATAAANLAQAAGAAATARVQEEATLRTQIYGLLTDPQKAELAKLQQEYAARIAQHQAEHPAE